MQIIDALKKRYQNKTCSKTCPLPNRRSGFGAAASFGLDTSTSIVLAAFLFTLLAWMTKWFDRTAVSLMLLLVFLFFQTTRPVQYSDFCFPILFWCW